jgi:hypothetical protein
MFHPFLSFFKISNKLQNTSKIVAKTSEAFLFDKLIFRDKKKNSMKEKCLRRLRNHFSPTFSLFQLTNQLKSRSKMLHNPSEAFLFDQFIFSDTKINQSKKNFSEEFPNIFRPLFHFTASNKLKSTSKILGKPSDAFLFDKFIF